MNFKKSLPVVVFILMFVNFVQCFEATSEHCSTDSIREYAVDACARLIDRKLKRQVPPSSLGYNIENVKRRRPSGVYHHHYHHRYPSIKKVTHAEFPDGGYLLIYYPLNHHRFPPSIDNTINEKSEEISNEILTQDLGLNKRKMKKTKLKRSIYPHSIIIKHCCSHLPETSCGSYFCH
ncbi:CLUMA_CG021401, isoform A [Clunio marinus]|uniref:CLUMA_CG021401, isoform A n=1 Tax=Clunio marinus TaxID=568069 RepID=A0A1J1J8N2_9DIPT|nr:CLUMA_CG021401, isoform A [Clunio marinus]